MPKHDCPMFILFKHNTLVHSGMVYVTRSNRKMRSYPTKLIKAGLNQEELNHRSNAFPSEMFYLLVWQFFPSNPGKHLHVYPLTASSHDPPCWHGPELHSFTSEMWKFSIILPVVSVGPIHLNLLILWQAIWLCIPFLPPVSELRKWADLDVSRSAVHEY